MLTASAREIQRNYRALFNQVQSKKQPLFILKGSEPEMVVLSLAMYEELLRGGDEAGTVRPLSNLPWRK